MFDIKVAIFGRLSVAFQDYCTELKLYSGKDDIYRPNVLIYPPSPVDNTILITSLFIPEIYRNIARDHSTKTYEDNKLGKRCQVQSFCHFYIFLHFKCLE